MNRLARSGKTHAATRVRRHSRFEGVTPADIAKRWREATPRFLRWVGLFGITSVGLFTYNHFAAPNQSVTNVINVAFQISAIFLVCFAFLTGMGYYYGREPNQ